MYRLAISSEVPSVSDTGVADGVEGFGIDEDDAIADIGYVSNDSVSEDGYEADDEWFDNGYHDLPHQEFHRYDGDVIDSFVYNEIPLDLVNPDEILQNNNCDPDININVLICVDVNGYDADDEWDHSDNDHDGFLDGYDV